MWVYGCFDGDKDMERAWVQHDLYFGHATPGGTIYGGSTLGWIWETVQDQARRRRQFIPWIDRNLDRIQSIANFSHKLLQVPHEHLAAYHRSTMPRVTSDLWMENSGSPYPTAKLESWRSFLLADIPNLLSSNEALITLAKLIVYRNFDASDIAYYKLQDILMRRYGFACVEKTWWAAEVRDRVLAEPDFLMPTKENSRGANAKTQK